MVRFNEEILEENQLDEKLSMPFICQNSNRNGVPLFFYPWIRGGDAIAQKLRESSHMRLSRDSAFLAGTICIHSY